MNYTITIGALELTPFTLRSSRELYCIRNHESVRRFMTSTDLIPYKAHRVWVEKNLLDGKELLLFMVRPAKGARAIGFTQLRVREDTAEIGVIFREAIRHQASSALCTVATLHLAFCHLNLAWLISYVIPAHQAAVAFNKAFGAREVASDRPGMIKLILGRDDCLSNAHYTRVFSRIKDKIKVVPVAVNTRSQRVTNKTGAQAC